MDPSNHSFSQSGRFHDDESAGRVEFGRNPDRRETHAANSSDPAVNEYDSNGDYEYRQSFIRRLPCSCFILF